MGLYPTNIKSFIIQKEENGNMAKICYSKKKCNSSLQLLKTKVKKKLSHKTDINAKINRSFQKTGNVNAVDSLLARMWYINFQIQCIM